MLKKFLLTTFSITLLVQQANAHCADGHCPPALLEGQVVMHPTDELSGLTCFPYKYKTTQDVEQTLGYLKPGTEVSSYVKPAPKVTYYTPKKKVIKQAKVKKAPVQESIVKDAYNDDIKPQSHYNTETKPEIQKEEVIQTPVQEEPTNTSSRASFIEFQEDDVELSATNTTIIENLINDLKASTTLVAKIHSYGYSSSGNSSEARRKSLQRAIKIRKFLIDNDISPSRISVNSIDDSGNTTNKVEIMLEDASL